MISVVSVFDKSKGGNIPIDFSIVVGKNCEQRHKMEISHLKAHVRFSGPKGERAWVSTTARVPV
jgi:hypothetical protein